MSAETKQIEKPKTELRGPGPLLDMNMIEKSLSKAEEKMELIAYLDRKFPDLEITREEEDVPAVITIRLDLEAGSETSQKAS